MYLLSYIQSLTREDITSTRVQHILDLLELDPMLVIESVRYINGEPIAIMKLSNGYMVMLHGYVTASLSTRHMFIQVTAVK